MLIPERGEVWRVRLDPTEGDEIGKTRPAIVLNPDSIGRLNLRVIVPVTDWKDRYATFPWMTCLEPNESNGLAKRSAADAFQIRSVSTNRFVNHLGVLSAKDLQAISAAIVVTVGFRLPSAE